MKKEVADLWVAALRSGDYPQAKGWLRTAEGYCCLGVLCEVALKAGLALDVSVSTEDSKGPWEYENGNATSLPVRVVNWADTKDADPEVRTNDPDEPDWFEPFSTLNDEKDFTFAEIATIIENHWEEI